MNSDTYLLTQKNNIISQHIFMTTSDTDGTIIDISQAYLEFTGYKREEVIGKNHKIFRNYDLDLKIIIQLWDVLTHDKVWIGELHNNKASGEEYWVKASITPLYNRVQKKIGYISIFEDISTQKRLEHLSTKDSLTQLHNRRYFDLYFKNELNRTAWKKEKFSLLLLGVDYYSEYKDNYGRVVADKLIIQIANKLQEHLSSKTDELFKVTEAEFAIILLNQDDAYIELFSKELLQVIEELHIENATSQISKYFTLSIGGVNIDTSKHTLLCNDIYNIADANLRDAKLQGRNRAVLKINTLQIDKLKHLDLITKLPNRTVLVHDISLLQNSAMLIILHIKQINTLKNLYGYNFTTKVIEQKAQELKNIIRDDKISLYSLNLQEFAILITNKNLYEKYLLLLKHSILINNNYYEYNLNKHISANFTAGIAYGQRNIFNHADLALQEAILSKNTYSIYHNNQTAIQLQEDNLQRLRVYKDALHEGKIIPYFQPIVDTISSKIVKYEALARLETEDGEIITPYYFLDSAKEDQSFEFFTRQMMQKVFNIYAKNNINISLNLSYENITSKSMLEYIQNRLEKYGGEGITFEILESEDVKDYRVLENFITMVKKYNSKISIDDFGSGYSNFTNILQLDIDYIKLDGSLVEKLNEDKNIENMIQGLILYSKNANIKTIAEFVSSKELAQRVKELGVDYSQGYFYGEPRAPQEYGLIEGEM